MQGDFFDTDVLVYASDIQTRAERSARLIDGGGAISVQVLNEFVAVARRKHRLDWERIRHFLSGVRALLTVHPVTVAAHDRALVIARRDHLQLHDAVIVASALEAGCRRLYTEDLQDGRVFDGRLTVTNPYA